MGEHAAPPAAFFLCIICSRVWAILLNRNEVPQVGSYARRLLLEALEEPQVLLEQQRYWKQEVFDLFLQHIRELMSASPDQALPLAKIAPELAQRVSASEEILMTRALALLGSAYRAVGDFQHSERCFAQVEEIKQVPTLELADVYRRKAYLRVEQGNVGEAFDLINKAIEIYRMEGDLFDRTPLGKTLAARGYFHHQAGHSGESLIDLSAAVGLIDHRDYPSFYYGAIHNLSVLLVEDGTPHQVSVALECLTAAYRQFIGYSQRHLAKYKLRWLQGLAHIRFGAIRKAESNFIISRKGFAEVNAPLEFAVISLDLAGIYFDEHRWGKLREISKDTFQVCKGLGASREILAALALWGCAVQQEQLTHELLRQARKQVLESGKPAGMG